jgi:transposase-like protein
MFSVSEKQQIVLSVLRGECTVAEAARRNKCSETRSVNGIGLARAGLEPRGRANRTKRHRPWIDAT